MSVEMGIQLLCDGRGKRFRRIPAGIGIQLLRDGRDKEFRRMSVGMRTQALSIVEGTKSRSNARENGNTGVM